MELQFTPENVVVNDMFGDGITYIIPSYQRPYSWDSIGKSDKNNQVNVMWEDIISFFQNESRSTYFLGSMVLIRKEDRVFEVVDGQQRLTTLVLLFISIKCFAKWVIEQNILLKNEVEDLSSFLGQDIPAAIDRKTFNSQLLGARTREKKVKIERGLGGNVDYDEVLKEVMECSLQTSQSLVQVTEEEKGIVKRFLRTEITLFRV